MLSVNPYGNVLCPGCRQLGSCWACSIWASRVCVCVWTADRDRGLESLVSQAWMVFGRACLHLAEIAAVDVEVVVAKLP